MGRSAGASLPTVNSAAFNNPAAISLNRGFGLESIHYQGKAQIGLVTGTGRVGAAISNFPSDGTFFGNPAMESINDYRTRATQFEKFEQEKLVLAGAINVFGGKKKKGLQLDIGAIYRRQTELAKDYWGGGYIISFNKIISFGQSIYHDVYYKDLSGSTYDIYDQYGNSTTVTNPIDPFYTTETDFTVKSNVIGFKFSNVAIDYIHFSTESDDTNFDGTQADIYNISYFYKYWIFSYGRRFESSYREIYQDEVFTYEKDKSNTFLGAQYATKKGFLLGIFSNYYLYNELSFGLTYFF